MEKPEEIIKYIAFQLVETYKKYWNNYVETKDYQSLKDVKAEFNLNNEHIIIYFNLPAYVEYLENGTGEKAGHSKYKKLVPINVIRNWVTLKHIPIPSKFKTQEDFVWAVSHRIAFGSKTDISGVEPKHILTNFKQDKKLLKEKNEIIYNLMTKIVVNNFYSEINSVL